MIRFPVQRVNPYFGLQSTAIQPAFAQPAETTSRRAKRFAVIGDAGSGTINQHVIGHRMWKEYQRAPFASVIALGDNVYEFGEPHLFEERIKAPYKPLFDNNVRFYPVMGNHDVRWGHDDEQRQYWNVPRWYNFKIGDAGPPGNNNELEFFAVDTTIMVPAYDDAHINDMATAIRLAKQQQKWLEEKLAASTARYKIVYGHYPMYTSGAHAYKKTSTVPMQKILEPTLKKYGVDVFLAGHEHLYERSAPIGGVQHIVSGGAGKMGSVYYPKPIYPREAIATKYHYMMFELTDHGLTFEAIDRNGNTIDQGSIVKGSAASLRFA